MPGTVNDLLAAARKAAQTSQAAQENAQATAAALRQRKSGESPAEASTEPHHGPAS